MQLQDYMSLWPKSRSPPPPPLDPNLFLPYSPDAGILVCVDRVLRPKVDLPVTVVQSLVPPGGLYLGDILEDAHFTVERDFKAKVKSQARVFVCFTFKPRFAAIYPVISKLSFG